MSTAADCGETRHRQIRHSQRRRIESLIFKAQWPAGTGLRADGGFYCCACSFVMLLASSTAVPAHLLCCLHLLLIDSVGAAAPNQKLSSY